MKQVFTLLFVCSAYFYGSSQATVSFYSYSWPNFAGDTISMSQYAGYKLVIVNVASQCSFTPNFAPLEQLDSLYRKYRFEVIGFPCNDFAHQQGTDSQLVDSCRSYHVDFPIMGSVKAITGDTAPLYKWLQCKSLNGVSDANVSWNFNLFLIDRQGNWVKHYSEFQDPMAAVITNWIIADSASLDTATAITAVNAESAIRFNSPNPTNSSISMQVNRDIQHLDINLFGIDGQLIGSIYQGTALNGQTIEYPVNALASGVYFIRANTNQGLKIFRCVVAH